MTGRVGNDAPSNDRRGASGRRVHFEVMVAVGSASGGSAFDAESVDVSGEGMRLRTAYLPEVGSELVCRFEGADGEVCAIGEVTWANEEQKGGEFGLKFVDLDDETRAALAALCQPEDGEEVEPLAPTVAKNARIKLHIEGLASPMKARVRDADAKTASVGSSLEFLKLGRQVEVEDVDAGARREGFVDGVKVEVDPKSSIPQLVVSLRFDAVARAIASAEPPREPREERGPDTVVAGRVPSTEKPKSVRAETPAPKSAAPSARVSSASDAPTSDEEEVFDDAELGLANGRAKQVKDAARELSTKARSTFAKVGTGASGWFSRMRQVVADKRSAREKAAKDARPPRVTAPPPSGALTSAGRRVVRQDKDKDDEERVSQPPQRSRKPLYIGAAAALLLLGGGAMALGGKSETEATKPAAVVETAKPVAGLPPIPGSPAMADIPLYGPTPLSTTEQVLPAEPNTAPNPKASDPSEDGEEAEEKAELVKEFGEGTVKNAKILKVRLDGAVAGFTATENEDGFTLTVPDRKSTSTSSALVRKDPRLSAVDVVNRDGGAEITVKFKGDVPGYKAKVRGDRIEIALSSEKAGSAKAAPKKVASKKAAPKKGAPKAKDTKKKAAPKAKPD